MRTYSISFIFAALLLVIPFFSSAFTSTPFFLPRSQGEDSARWIAGWVHQGNRFDQEPCIFGSFAAIAEYTQTYKPDDIERFLFGEDLFSNCCNPFIKISGSQILTRNNEKEWLADYFGLPNDFESIVHFTPKVTNSILDFSGYIRMNEWYDGLYLTLEAPLVVTSWFLDMRETVISKGFNGYIAGYMAPSPVSRANLLQNFTEFASCQKTPQLPDGIVFCPLESAIVAPKKQTKFGLADLHAAVGYNFLLQEDYHLGLNARLVIPTGTRPRGKYLFEPIIGNGHFYEMGLGISAHAILWRDEPCDQQWGLAMEAWVTHMFKTRQIRSFDLKGADNSRYMLAELMTDVITDQLNAQLTAGATMPDAQFNKVLAPLANITTVPVDVSVLWQADVSLLFNYKGCNWEFDFGYNFWSRQPESVSIVKRSSCTLINQAQWGVKGDVQLYGYREGDDKPIALSATQLGATVTGGLNYPELKPGEGIENNRIDNPNEAFSGFSPGVAIMTTPGGTDQIKTSVQPIILTSKELAPCRSSTHGVANGIFGHLNYTWWEHDEWYIPYLGFGLKIDIAPEKPNRTCPTLCTHNPQVGASPCGTCDDETLLQTGLSQWCLWIKGGFTFN